MERKSYYGMTVKKIRTVEKSSISNFNEKQRRICICIEISKLKKYIWNFSALGAEKIFFFVKICKTGKPVLQANGG